MKLSAVPPIHSWLLAVQSLPANVPLKQGLTNIRLLLGIILITCCQTVFAEITLIPEKKAPLPLVSATELDPLTAKTIKQRYPEGFRIFTTNITPLLRKKLKKLATENYNVLFIQPDNRELRQLALSVIQHDGFNTFLVKVFGEQPGCSPFLSREMVEYGTRKNNIPMVRKVSGLQGLSESDLKSLITGHHWWTNIGFESYQKAPESIMTWLSHSGSDNAPVIASALKDCSVSFNEKRLAEFSQLTALSYLNNAARGLFYRKQGGKLTHYRTLAVEVPG